MKFQTVKYLSLVIAGAVALAQAGPIQASPALSDESQVDGAALLPGANPGISRLGQTPLVHDLHAGAVVNQTITLIGQDFYQNFVAAWREKPLSERYVISVHERPSARLGSQVWVEYANRRVFQVFLPPARARARDAGVDAVEVAYQNIVDTDVLNLLFRDPDLGPDELKN
ncbi:MAG: hypothetical protein JWP77_1748 [Polaromonas sp.]|nr:hypothetical protein [Polaromonas sp.]